MSRRNPYNCYNKAHLTTEITNITGVKSHIMGAKKTKKSKKAKKINLDISGWNTTDADEIERRRLRGEMEKFRIENVDPKFYYFSTFLVNSKQDKQYYVEIRSLTEQINSCDCH